MAATRPVATRCWVALLLAVVLMPARSEALASLEFSRSMDGITYGHRVLGDEELFRTSAKKIPNLFLTGRTEVVTYPPWGVLGDYITCIVVTVPKGQSWNQHTVKILEGGVGQRQVTIEIHSPPLRYLDYSVVIYGEKEIKLPIRHQSYGQWPRSNHLEPSIARVSNEDLSEQDSNLISQRHEKTRDVDEDEISVEGQETIKNKDEKPDPVQKIINHKQSGRELGQSHNMQDVSDQGMGSNVQGSGDHGMKRSMQYSSGHGKDSSKTDSSDHSKSNDKQEGTDHSKGNDKQGSSDHVMGSDVQGSGDYVMTPNVAKARDKGERKEHGKTRGESGEIMSFDDSYSNSDTNPVIYLNQGRNYDQHKMYDESNSLKKEHFDWYLLIERSGRSVLLGPVAIKLFQVQLA